MSTVCTTAEFDAYAARYDEALNQGLALSGESKSYFAEGRMVWLAKRLRERGLVVKNALDFGCGTGSATPYFASVLNCSSLIGLDVSASSLAVATRVHGSASVRFCLCTEYKEQATIDLAFTNGVFHHIPPAERPAALAQVFTALRPGGLFAFWENNPWNPGTRWIMSRVPFDRDAQMVWPHAGRRLLRAAGFEIVSTDFAFVFPAALRRLRCLEPYLCHLALGGQYLILAQRPIA